MLHLVCSVVIKVLIMLPVYVYVLFLLLLINRIPQLSQRAAKQYISSRAKLNESLILSTSLVRYL